MTILKKFLFVTLIVASVFSTHARKLLNTATHADEAETLTSQDDESGGSSGGASCV